MINKEYIASELYTAYCKAVGGKAFNGDPLPDWETLYTDETKAKQTSAWIASAERAIQLLFPEEEVDSTFAGALNSLKEGHALQRSGWNGKGLFVYMVPTNSYPAQTGVAKAHFGDGAMVPYGAYFAIKGADGIVNTWIPSISDILANDWVPVYPG